MKNFYVVSWNFGPEKEFTDYNEAVAFFNEKVGSVSYVELKKVSKNEICYRSESVKIWHR